jgi:dGTPase
LILVADPSIYTTRLLHSVKVAQIAKTISRALRLNEDLTEAIALGHDLGHAPFGHIGEDILRTLVLSEGGFEHNEESVLVATFFEPLNLTFQTLEGILKHTRFSFTPYDKVGVHRTNPFEKFRVPGRGQKTYCDPFHYWGGRDEENKLVFRTLSNYEGQVVDIADEIAYVCHDIADAMTASIVTDEELPMEWLERCGNDPGNAIDEFVSGVMEENYQALATLAPDDRAYELKHPADLSNFVQLMKDWFKEKVYKTQEKENIEKMLQAVFELLLRDAQARHKLSPFGDKVVINRGFKDKLLAVHVVTMLTDDEVRQIYQKSL